MRGRARPLGVVVENGRWGRDFEGFVAGLEEGFHGAHNVREDLDRPEGEYDRDRQRVDPGGGSSMFELGHGFSPF